MDKKSKQQFTNEKMLGKFKSLFELVNYSISLAENMIRTGRDARVKSDVQNRAMLVLAEISEGKDQFDEIKTPEVSISSADGTMAPQRSIFEERPEKRKYRTSDASSI